MIGRWSHVLAKEIKGAGKASGQGTGGRRGGEKTSGLGLDNEFPKWKPSWAALTEGGDLIRKQGGSEPVNTLCPDSSRNKISGRNHKNVP